MMPQYVTTKTMCVNIHTTNSKKENRDQKVHKQDEDCESCYILDPILTVFNQW